MLLERKHVSHSEMLLIEIDFSKFSLFNKKSQNSEKNLPKNMGFFFAVSKYILVLLSDVLVKNLRLFESCRCYTSLTVYFDTVFTPLITAFYLKPLYIIVTAFF